MLKPTSLLVLALALQGAGLRGEVMPEPIAYTLRFPAPQTHYVEAEARIPTGGRAEVELAMAVWTPGSYLVREYARNVEEVTAATVSANGAGALMRLEHDVVRVQVRAPRVVELRRPDSRQDVHGLAADCRLDVHEVDRIPGGGGVMGWIDRLVCTATLETFDQRTGHAARGRDGAETAAAGFQTAWH